MSEVYTSHYSEFRLKTATSNIHVYMMYPELKSKHENANISKYIVCDMKIMDVELKRYAYKDEIWDMNMDMNLKYSCMDGKANAWKENIIDLDK